MLIGLVLNGCYNSQQKEAIEKCRRNCKYPLTFEVINTSSTSIPARIDTTTYGVCYCRQYNNGTYYTNSFKLKEYDLLWKVDDYISFLYFDKLRIDSIRTYTIREDCPGYTSFKVTYSAKNAFGVPEEDTRYFEIVKDCVYDLYNFSDIDTISINRFVNNSPKKIFRTRDEIEKYLQDFESNFKLKN